MLTGRPLVTIATACEKVLFEKDNVTSVIRVVDTFHIPEPPPDLPQGVKISITAFVAIKSGDIEGPQEFSLLLRDPDGNSPLGEFKWPVILKGQEHGSNLLLTLELAATAKLGVYWCDVIWKDQILASFPIKLARAEKQASQESSHTN